MIVGAKGTVLQVSPVIARSSYDEAIQPCCSLLDCFASRKIGEAANFMRTRNNGISDVPEHGFNEEQVSPVIARSSCDEAIQFLQPSGLLRFA